MRKNGGLKPPLQAAWHRAKFETNRSIKEGTIYRVPTGELA